MPASNISHPRRNFPLSRLIPVTLPPQVKHLIWNLDAEEEARALDCAAAGAFLRKAEQHNVTLQSAKKRGKLEYQVNGAAVKRRCSMIDGPKWRGSGSGRTADCHHHTLFVFLICLVSPRVLQVLHLIRSLEAEEANHAT